VRPVAGEGVRRGRRFGDVHVAQKTRGVLLGEFAGTFEDGQAERPINDLVKGV
jgi:ribosomal protein S19